MNYTIHTEKITSLNLSENNPNIGNVPAIAESIEEFGFLDCVVAVDREGARRVIAGHHRILGAEKNGIFEVPVFWVDLPELEADAYMVAENKIGDRSVWDIPKLGEISGKFSSFDGIPFKSQEEVLLFAETRGGFGMPTINISLGDFKFSVTLKEWERWEAGLREEASANGEDAVTVLKTRLGVV